MSLNKAIEHGKERRKPHYKSKAFDRSCCNHRGCEYCIANRKHRDKVRITEAENEIIELEKENAESQYYWSP